jgi:hypothetical protein
MRKLRFDLNIASNALLCPNPSEFYSKAYITEDVVNNYRAIPGVKSETKVANVLFDNVLQAANCNFAASPTTMSAVDVNVCPMSAMVEICRYDLESSFVALQMARGAAGSWDVPTFLNYYWDELSKDINEEINVIRWRGDTSFPSASGSISLCDGYQKLISGSTATVKSATSGSVTSANVLTKLATMYTELPSAVQSKPEDLRFYLSSNFATAYQIAAATNNTVTNVTTALPLSYLGVPVVVAAGASNNVGVLTSKNNLIYAFDGEGQEKALKAVNLEDTVAEPVLRTRAEIKIGFQIVNPAEIVYHKPV